MLASSLQVVQVFQEREEWMGLEEEVVMVERREVGCQSDSVEIRDAGVQVDLLTQQLLGMTWRCVAVRPGEPGGGALLQHCSTCGTRAQTLPNILLPLWGPADTTDHQQAATLPSMPLCEPLALLPPADATAAPPPGLIAPLSPRLAEEEEEEEEDEASSKAEISGHTPSKVTEEKRRRGERRCQQSEGGAEQGQSKPSSPAHRQRRRRKRNWEKMNQSESRRRIKVKTQRPRRRRNIQTGCFSSARGGDTTEAEGAEEKAVLEEEKMDDRRRSQRLEKKEVMEKRRRRRRKEETEGGTPVKMKSEFTERPRRKAVGPPIRYLLEYEGWSQGVSKGRGAEEAEEEEPRERSNRRRKRGGGNLLHQLHLSNHRAGGRRRGATVRHWTRRKRRVQKNARRWVILSTMKRSGRRRSLENNKLTMRLKGRSRKEEEHEKERGGGVLLQRPRRTMVGPPIRYLLESEVQSRGRDAEGVPKPQRRTEAGGGASDDSESTAQTGPTNPDGPKRKRGRPKMVRGGGASGMTDAEKKKKTDLPQRLRRTMVGPPIRYLLESERWSHGNVAVKAEGSDWELKPQKKSDIGGGALVDAAMIDRSEDTESKGTQTGKTESTNEDGAHGRPEKTAGGQTGEGQRRRRRRSGEEVREGGGGEKRRRREAGRKVDEDKKEPPPPQRPKRTMVGPPIRYLLESEELSLSREATNQGSRCVNKPQRKNEGEGGALDDTVMIDRSENTDYEKGRPKKVRGDSEAGGGASGMIDRSKAAERQTDSYLQTALTYFDPQNGQVTVLAPCCVRLQLLP
ncbi:Hypothetical predicted protein [Xyrichtys novacula]|uniref:Uncharacterized protein n=1 Tax=Xyrichtys novacula TaxID=13765 RepID=A0AAV1H6U3_XYRNO|nr:Hypothetical predicted protein [Xyrichtys novacula]